MELDLKRFIVFNISDGQGEGREQDKLLYHWTKDVIDNKVDITEQIDDVCLCDASINASNRLSMGLCLLSQPTPHEFKANSKTDRIERLVSSQSIVITFDSTLIVKIEVEPERSIWMAVHVSPKLGTPSGQYTNLDQSGFPAEAIKQVLRNIYLRFCLLNGTFQMIADDVVQSEEASEWTQQELGDSIRERMRTICASYFHSALVEIHLTSLISNVASLNNYLVYLDLNPITLMKVISFINHLVTIDPTQILQTITIFNEQLVWSSLNSENTRLLYNYLAAVLIRKAMQEELVKETEKVRLIAEDLPVYLSETRASQNDNLESGIKQLKIDNSKGLGRYYLSVFRSRNNLTLGVIFKNVGQSELIRKCEQVLMNDSRLGVIPLPSLAKMVGQNFIKTSSNTNTASTSGGSNLSLSRRRLSNSSTSSTKSQTPSDHRYISLDRISYSVSSVANVDSLGKDGHPPVLLEGMKMDAGKRKLRFVRQVLELEADIQDIVRQTGRRVEEYIAKTINDSWLAVLNTKYRYTYSLYKMKYAGLSEARASAISLRSALVMNRS